MIFKDAFIPLFPQRPKNKTRKKNPEGVEDGRRVGASGPEAKNHGDVPSGFVLLAVKAAFFPEGVSQRAEQEEMLDSFHILQAIRALGWSSETSFD